MPAISSDDEKNSLSDFPSSDNATAPATLQKVKSRNITAQEHTKDKLEDVSKTAEMEQQDDREFNSAVSLVIKNNSASGQENKEPTITEMAERIVKRTEVVPRVSRSDSPLKYSEEVKQHESITLDIDKVTRPM